MDFRYTSLIIGGPPASGKSSLLKGLNDELKIKNENWPTYSAGDYLRSLHKKVAPNVLFQDWWPTLTIEDQLDINVGLVQMVKTGEARIVDTRYPQIYGRDSLKVYLDCDLRIRSQRAVNKDLQIEDSKLKRYPGKSVEDIMKILEKREIDEVNVGKKLFGSYYDYRDETHYDLFLNSGTMSIRKEVAVILDILEGVIL